MDDHKVLVALLNWLEAQGLAPREAAMLCAKVCGILATQEPQVAWLSAIMRDTNQQAHPAPPAAPERPN